MSTLSKTDTAFGRANPHALAAILEASETKRIIAATDIFDISGTKLWASNQPVSAALQRKLLDRQLRQPLESCLVAQDGVTAISLLDSLNELLQSDTPLAPILRAHGARLAREAAYLPLHPVAQLLLTAVETSRPHAYDHAVAAMALNGALMAGSGGDVASIRLAMLCGLLHDIGEMYIAPQHGEADADRDLDFTSYQQLVVHPHVGALLVSQLTNYPASLARAVLEHHERLDGSGYPHALVADRFSPLGRLLAVTEATLAAVRSPYDTLLRGSVALRAVPGEFDLAWVGRVSQAACAQPPQKSVMEPADVQARLVALGDVLSAAEINVAAVAGRSKLLAMKKALELSQFLIGRLRAGWNESGLWNPNAMAAGDAAEVEALEDELYFRLRGVQRATLLAAGKLPPEESAVLTAVCESLAMG
ncbi:MAG: HD domain-containing phosphohydrolase [Betaproteobacteria bacterium]